MTFSLPIAQRCNPGRASSYSRSSQLINAGFATPSLLGRSGRPDRLAASEKGRQLTALEPPDTVAAPDTDVVEVADHKRECGLVNGLSVGGVERHDRRHRRPVSAVHRDSDVREEVPCRARSARGTLFVALQNLA